MAEQIDGDGPAAQQVDPLALEEQAAGQDDGYIDAIDPLLLDSDDEDDDNQSIADAQSGVSKRRGSQQMVFQGSGKDIQPFSDFQKQVEELNRLHQVHKQTKDRLVQKMMLISTRDEEIEMLRSKFSPEEWLKLLKEAGLVDEDSDGSDSGSGDSDSDDSDGDKDPSCLEESSSSEEEEEEAAEEEEEEEAAEDGAESKAGDGDKQEPSKGNGNAGSSPQKPQLSSHSRRKSTKLLRNVNKLRRTEENDKSEEDKCKRKLSVAQNLSKLQVAEMEHEIASLQTKLKAARKKLLHLDLTLQVVREFIAKQSAGWWGKISSWVATPPGSPLSPQKKNFETDFAEAVGETADWKTIMAEAQKQRTLKSYTELRKLGLSYKEAASRMSIVAGDEVVLPASWQWTSGMSGSSALVESRQDVLTVGAGKAHEEVLTVEEGHILCFVFHVEGQGLDIGFALHKRARTPEKTSPAGRVDRHGRKSKVKGKAADGEDEQEDEQARSRALHRLPWHGNRSGSDSGVMGSLFRKDEEQLPRYSGSPNGKNVRPVRGFWGPALEPCEAVLRWDNTYSIMNPKTIFYAVKIFSPGDGFDMQQLVQRAQEKEEDESDEEGEEESTAQQITRVFSKRPFGIDLKPGNKGGDGPIGLVRVKNVNRDDLPVKVEDVVVAVNGQDVRHMEVQQMFDKLKAIRLPVSITFERDEAVQQRLSPKKREGQDGVPQAGQERAANEREEEEEAENEDEDEAEGDAEEDNEDDDLLPWEAMVSQQSLQIDVDSFEEMAQPTDSPSSSPSFLDNLVGKVKKYCFVIFVVLGPRQWVLRRRFSEFEKLWLQLEPELRASDDPDAPVFPSKAHLTLGILDEEGLEQRRRDLNIFMQQVVKRCQRADVLARTRGRRKSDLGHKRLSSMGRSAVWEFLDVEEQLLFGPGGISIDTGAEENEVETRAATPPPPVGESSGLSPLAQKLMNKARKRSRVSMPGALPEPLPLVGEGGGGD